jgi:hypothetical protein
MAKKKSSKSPTQRTLDLCRKSGLTAQVVERWERFSRRRIDLFGVIDIVAIGGGQIIGIQSTAGSGVSARRRKILCEPRAKLWVTSGGRLYIHGWRKLITGWAAREIEIVSSDFPADM